jgi:hypothetical protein
MGPTEGLFRLSCCQKVGPGIRSLPSPIFDSLGHPGTTPLMPTESHHHLNFYLFILFFF